MSSISRGVRDGFTYELATLAILPAIATILWQIAVQAQLDVPFAGSLLTMIVLNYAALGSQNWGGYADTYLMGRIVADVLSVGLTISVTNVVFPFKGIPTPTTWQTTLQTGAGMISVMGTSRAFAFLFLLIQEKFMDNTY